MERLRHIRKEPYTKPAHERAASWLATHGAPFTQQLTSSNVRRQRAAQQWSLPPQLYDSAVRTFEEMPVCTFWKAWSTTKPLPSGFQIVNGSVLIQDESFLRPGQYPRLDHTFLCALDDPDTILDHCAAQFYRRGVDPDLSRGDRLAVLREMAGDMLHPVRLGDGTEHFFLVGSRREIERRVCLIYDQKPRTSQ